MWMADACILANVERFQEMAKTLHAQMNAIVLAKVKRWWTKKTYLLRGYIRVRNQLSETKDPILLASTPEHGNLGDQAITLGMYHILKKIFPNRQIIEMPTVLCLYIKKYHLPIPMPDDMMVVCPGGGNLGSLYLNEEEVHRWVANFFCKHSIVIFPQSIYFAQNQQGEQALRESQKAYAQADDLTIMERDAVSYEAGQKIFPRARHMLVPDAANVLGAWRKNYCLPRRGVCFLLRQDKEKVRSDEMEATLRQYLNDQKIPYWQTDTVTPRNIRTMDERARYVAGKIHQLEQARLVITDRYHGMIFSVLARTPVLVFPSYDTKISTGIAWFQDVEDVCYGDGMTMDGMKAVIDKYCLHEPHRLKNTSDCSRSVEEAVRKVMNSIDGAGR